MSKYVYCLWTQLVCCKCQSNVNLILASRLTLALLTGFKAGWGAWILIQSHLVSLTKMLWTAVALSLGAMCNLDMPTPIWGLLETPLGQSLPAWVALWVPASSYPFIWVRPLHIFLVSSFGFVCTFSVSAFSSSFFSLYIPAFSNSRLWFYIPHHLTIHCAFFLSLWLSPVIFFLQL